MDMRERDDEREKRKESPTVPRQADDLPVCGKAFSPEIARNQDEDEPCEDGVG